MIWRVHALKSVMKNVTWCTARIDATEQQTIERCTSLHRPIEPGIKVCIHTYFYGYLQRSMYVDAPLVMVLQCSWVWHSIVHCSTTSKRAVWESTSVSCQSVMIGVWYGASETVRLRRNIFTSSMKGKRRLSLYQNLGEDSLNERLEAQKEA